MSANHTLLKTLYQEVKTEENHDKSMPSDASRLKNDAALLSDEEKISLIAFHFREIMQTLGLNPEDDSLRKTPERVAKMYVKEIFSGLNPANKPKISMFNNHYQYDEMLVEKNITLYSYCEHHFVPIIGKVHIAYYSNKQVIGLSKLNRIVQYYGRRPQVQERLTVQIAQALKEALNTDDVAVIIDAEHLCMSSRGIGDTHAGTLTSSYSGKFQKEKHKREFLNLIRE